MRTSSRAAMLPTPSTSPSHDAVEMVDAESDAAPSIAWDAFWPTLLATQDGHGEPHSLPAATASSLVDGDAPHPDLGLQSPHLTDEDQDMSEGGAPLFEAANQASLDELLGEEPLVTAPDPPSLISSPHLPPPYPVLPLGDFDDDMLYDEFEPAEAASLPTSMLEVSQQLEHLQGAHESVDFLGIAGVQHDNVADHSIPPLLLPTQSFISFESSEEPSQVDVASSMDASSLNPQVVGLALGLPGVLHPGGHEGFAASAGEDASAPNQSHEVTTPHHLITLEISWDDDDISDADPFEVDDQFNLSLVDFLYSWARNSAHEDGTYGFSRKTAKGPSLPAILRQTNPGELQPLTRSDLQGDRCDIQRINWEGLGVSRTEAKKMRKRTYKNYSSLRLPTQWQLKTRRLSSREDYFKFRQMNFNHEVHLSHFQLRNLVACASRDHIFYAGISKVMQYSPTSRSNPRGLTSIAMDLTDPLVQPYHAFSSGVQISTLTIAHDILVAGGFSGEYGITNLRASRSARHSEGIISDHPNSITNHVQVQLSRSSSLPLVAFSSNDNAVRLLDVNTNKFVAEHKFEHAINCSAISPDQRLRVLVGDAQNVLICNADTGAILQELDGHRDFGFACDWADDGWTVATGNQDMQVKIWDARKWTNSKGTACPITTIAAEMAGVRKLKFSPCGSGKRLLVAAEPADFISIINAETFDSKQTLNFFGEIGGVDFTNDGQDLFVGNCDSMRGGIMEFERCDFASAALSGLDEQGERRGDWYDWDAEDESVGRLSRGRSSVVQQRRPARLGTTMGHF